MTKQNSKMCEKAREIAKMAWDEAELRKLKKSYAYQTNHPELV